MENNLIDYTNNIPSVSPIRDRSINNDEMLIALFLKNQNSQNTRRSYTKSINIFRDFTNKPLHKISVKDVLDFIDSLEGNDKSTKNNRLAALSSLYNFGLKLGYLIYNPFVVINKPKVSKDKAIEKFLTKDEVSSIWEQLRIKERNAVIGSILITTGIRVSELCNIKCSNFYRDKHGNIGIRIVDGKGDKDRDIKVRKDVMEFIKIYRASINREFDIPSSNDEYLLLTRTLNRVSENYIRWIISSAVNKAGLDKKVSPHWYRHTSASMSLQNGCDLAKVTENFGWSSLKTAQRYLHNIDKLNDTSVDYVDIEL